MTTVLTDLQASANIASNLQKLLKDKKIKQTELARAVGESDMRVSLIVRGRVVPSVGVVARIADFLQVPIDDIVHERLPVPYKYRRSLAS